MLNIESLSYRYQSRQQFTLKNISLRLREGEMLLLAGRSGCGKSTLLKAISGLLADSDGGELVGKIYFDDADIALLTPEQVGQLVGTVYQTPDDQLFAMTVADEVGFALENQGLEHSVIQRRVAETLAMVGLRGYQERSIHQLSGGQRQRLALASILVSRPKLVILDEPVSQMNPGGVQSFMELLVKLNREEHISILMIEHRVNELAGYFQRLAVMQEGELVFDGSMEEAWYALSEITNTGIREPQPVKLCRLLQLPRLTAEPTQVIEQIKEGYKVHCSERIKAKEKIKAKELLEVKNLEFTYPGAVEPTLHRLNFNLEKGRITALMGSNGAGKSTLLNILGGLTSGTAGQVLLGGRLLEQSLGLVCYLRQEPDLMLLADTVRQELCWKNEHLQDFEVERLLDKLKLSQYGEDFPLALSKGQRVRVVLGAMFARKPQLLLLDEPTTGQDEESLTEIKRLLLDYKQSGGSVFLCTHDMELAAAVADRVILLKDGKIIADAEAAAVLSDRSLLGEGGLVVPALLNICQGLQLPPCINVEEVKAYVHAPAVGGD